LCPGINYAIGIELLSTTLKKIKMVGAFYRLIAMITIWAIEYKCSLKKEDIKFLWNSKNIREKETGYIIKFYGFLIIIAIIFSLLLIISGRISF